MLECPRVRWRFIIHSGLGKVAWSGRRFNALGCGGKEKEGGAELMGGAESGGGEVSEPLEACWGGEAEDEEGFVGSWLQGAEGFGRARGER